jgi:DNA-binding transcriptional MerR regulator
MVDQESITATLYSRQQVALLTGIDDSTLNYWMREGVLRAAEGGTGKGQHRRFPYHQINLALLLDQLRGFGVALPAIKRLAARFHNAIEHYQQVGITRDNDDTLSSIIYIRQQIEKNGFCEESVPEDKVGRYLELFPWFVGKILRRKYKHLAFNFEATFEEAVEILRRAYLAYDRPIDPTERFPDDLVDLAKGLDLAARSAAHPYWSAITYIESKSPDEVYEDYYTPLVVYRNSSGEWEVTSGDPSSSMLSYVGIYLEKISNEAWAKLASGDQR